MNSEAANCVIKFETSRTVDHRSSHGLPTRVLHGKSSNMAEWESLCIYIRTEKMWTGL